ncbi:MAG: aminotransferase class IV [Campylobacterota bacterium]|nr:aminotransferase class IV [Campylobacterota bacterium]
MDEYLETIKALNGELYHLKYHEKRSEIENIESYLNPPKDGLYRCRLVYSDDKIDVTYHRYKKREINSLKLIYDDNISYSKKSTDRAELNNLFIQKDDCDDVLIVKNGLITDTSIANIALYKNGIWFTPKTPLLKGTTRARLLEESFLFEIDIKVENIKEYTKIALLNAMIDFDIIPTLKIKGI